MISIPLIASTHDCSYLLDQSACSTFVSPSFPMSTSLYAQLLAKGFRRSGDDVYAPKCPACSACIPVRIPVAAFKPNRNQRRCLTKNALIQAVIKPAIFEQPHYDLYCRYQQVKHPDGDMQYASAKDYLRFLSSTWCDTYFVEFTLNKRLVAISVIDCFDDALSAVYTFFDPDLATHSLGVFAVLWQIQTAKDLDLDWLYLGYWIADCQKMSYKSHYQPQEQYQYNQWLSV